MKYTLMMIVGYTISIFSTSFASMVILGNLGLNYGYEQAVGVVVLITFVAELLAFPYRVDKLKETLLP